MGVLGHALEGSMCLSLFPSRAQAKAIIRATFMLFSQGAIVSRQVFSSLPIIMPTHKDNQLKEVLNIFQSLIFPPQREKLLSLYNSNIKCTPKGFFSLPLVQLLYSTIGTDSSGHWFDRQIAFRKTLSDDSDVSPSSSYCLLSLHTICYSISSRPQSLGILEAPGPNTLDKNQGQKEEDGCHLEMRLENQ